MPFTTANLSSAIFGAPTDATVHPITAFFFANAASQIEVDRHISKMVVWVTSMSRLLYKSYSSHGILRARGGPLLLEVRFGWGSPFAWFIVVEGQGSDFGRGPLLARFR